MANKKTRVGVVLPKRLNVRKTPGGNVVGLLKSGDAVDVISDKDGWLKIRYENFLAWVNGEFVAVEVRSE